MKLEEKHKEFVVKCFARFMTLTTIVDAFMDEFADDLPQPDISDLPTLDEWMAELLEDEAEQAAKLKMMNESIERNREAYTEEYGDEADENSIRKHLKNISLTAKCNTVSIVERSEKKHSQSMKRSSQKAFSIASAVLISTTVSSPINTRHSFIRPVTSFAPITASPTSTSPKTSSENWKPFTDSRNNAFLGKLAQKTLCNM